MHLRTDKNHVEPELTKTEAALNVIL
jgi:hypothetical protein